jgi:hypothetical protein
MAFQPELAIFGSTIYHAARGLAGLKLTLGMMVLVMATIICCAFGTDQPALSSLPASTFIVTKWVFGDTTDYGLMSGDPLGVLVILCCWIALATVALNILLAVLMEAYTMINTKAKDFLTASGDSTSAQVMQCVAPRDRHRAVRGKANLTTQSCVGCRFCAPPSCLCSTRACDASMRG